MLNTARELAEAISRARRAVSALPPAVAHCPRRARCPSCLALSTLTWCGWQRQVPPEPPLPLRNCSTCRSTVVLLDEIPRGHSRASQ